MIYDELWLSPCMWTPPEPIYILMFSPYYKPLMGWPPALCPEPLIWIILLLRPMRPLIYKGCYCAIALASLAAAAAATGLLLIE